MIKTIICPCCGEQKHLWDLNRCNGPISWWSDEEVPSWPFRMFFIQKCTSCGEYSFLEDWKVMRELDDMTADEEDICPEDGQLTYEEKREAFGAVSCYVDTRREMKLRMMLLHAMNDRYYRDGGKEEISGDERQLFVDNIRCILESPDLGDVFRAELHREIGEFDECCRILGESSNILARKDLGERILSEAKAGNSRVVDLSDIDAITGRIRNSRKLRL